jgi:hypothetical protein
MNNQQKSKEVLFHFSCEKCKKWWSIGDAPEDREEWFCPWCGYKNDYSADHSNINTTPIDISIKK